MKATETEVMTQRIFDVLKPGVKMRVGEISLKIWPEGGAPYQTLRKRLSDLRKTGILDAVKCKGLPVYGFYYSRKAGW